MDDEYPETINGVCVKVEPRSPSVEPRENLTYEETFSRRQKFSVEENMSNGYTPPTNYTGHQSRSHSQSSSEISATGFSLSQSAAFGHFRKSASPAISEELKTRMSPSDCDFDTSTPSFKADKFVPRVSSSYHLSKGTPPSMLGDSIYSYASFNDDSYSKMNMILKTESNGDSFDDADSKLNLTYPGTARPIGKKAHLPKRYKCAMCAYKTRYKSDLNRHVRKHAVAGYNCDICNMPFKTVGNVEFHKRREHADNYVATKQEKKPKFNCKLCTFGTMQSSELTRHVRKHYIAKFTCTLCNRPFMSSGSLVHHKRSIHNISDEDICNGQDGDQAASHNGEVEPVIESDEENYQSVTNNNHIQPDSKHNGLGLNKECHDVNGNVDGLTETIAAVAEKDETSPSDEIEDKNGETIEEEPNKSIPNGKQSEPKGGEAAAKHKCQFCHKTFGRKLVLDYHLKNIHKMKIKEDESAFLEYDDDYDLALDMSIQELESCEPNKYDANVLNTVSEREDFKHMRHQCPFCAYATNYKSTYDRHVKKHDLECHICHVCRMPFITFGHMQRHIRDNHPEYHKSLANTTATDKGISPQKNRNSHFEKPPLKMSFKRDFDKPFQSGIANYQAVSLNGNSHVNNSFSPIAVTSKRKRHPPIQRQMEEGVTVDPPTMGRYAKLVSNFDDFAARPFACALCFFRTKNIEELVKHTKNHLTGCNPQPVPDTARFNVAFLQQFQNKTVPKIERPDFEQPVTQPNMQTFRKPNNKLQDVISKLWNEPKPVKRPFEEDIVEDESANDISDSIVPTFSVHYRKDKTNLTRPYLCLLCRKRFRLLTILKQHFRQTHSESQINTKSYTCSICGEVFNSPVLLQEHHDFQHKMQAEVLT